MKEQEEFHKQLMIQSTAIERFQKLYKMQQFNLLLHPVTDHSRKIRIGKGTS
jgi:hypothetical protein